MYPLVELVGGAITVFALCEADVGEVVGGEFLGKQFQHVSGAVLRHRGFFISSANEVSKVVELQPEVVVQAPAAERLNIRFPLHAVGDVDADGQRTDVGAGGAW